MTLAKHLSALDVTTIVDVIRTWGNEKITWEGICAAVFQLTSHRPSRQTLNAHPAIRLAYASKKQGLRITAPQTPMPSSLAVAALRIQRQQSEIDELKRINTALMEQFVRWQYNSYKYGIKERQLNENLPRIDRERTAD